MLKYEKQTIFYVEKMEILLSLSRSFFRITFTYVNATERIIRNLLPSSNNDAQRASNEIDSILL